MLMRAPGPLWRRLRLKLTRKAVMDAWPVMVVVG